MGHPANQPFKRASIPDEALMSDRSSIGPGVQFAVASGNVPSTAETELDLLRDRVMRARVVTTTNVALNGTVTSYDGVTFAAGDIVLVAAQSTGSQNDLYTIPASGAWQRVSTAIADRQLVRITEGTYAGTLYELATDGAITIGTTTMQWSEIKAARPSPFVCRLVMLDDNTPSGLVMADGVSPSNGDLVLLVGNSTTSQNGPYIVNTAGAWSRAGWTLYSGMEITIAEGSTCADTVWMLTTNGAITPGTTGQTWAQSGNARVHKSGSRLGVGTTAPAAALDVHASSGDAAVRGEGTSGGGVIGRATSGSGVEGVADTGSAGRFIRESTSTDAGTAAVLKVEQQNPDNAGPAAEITNAGSGKGVVVTTATGRAADLVNTGSAVTLAAQNHGTGPVVGGYRADESGTDSATTPVTYGINDNPDSAGAGVLGQTAGSGPGVHGKATGTGEAIRAEGQIMKVRTVITGSVTALITALGIDIGSIPGAITITIPDPSTWSGREFEIWDIMGAVSATNTVTVARPVGATFSFRGGAAGTGATSAVIMNAPYQGRVVLRSTGTSVLIG